MSNFMSREMVHYYKQMYPKGTRICIDSMENDPNPIPSGTCGKVDFVDDAGTIHCIFDDGRTLGVVPNEDRFHVVEEQKFKENLSIKEFHQSDLRIETKPVSILRFICPLKIRITCDNGYEVIPSVDINCADEINDFIYKYTQPTENRRGLMAYYCKDSVISEKVFSVIPSVKVFDGELMGIYTCQVCEDLTEVELSEFEDFLIAQSSDGFGEGFEQQGIKTDEYGEIYVSFWSDNNNWSMQIEGNSQTLTQAEEMTLMM